MKVIKDKGTLIDDIVVALKKEKAVRVARLGTFEVKVIKGRKVFNQIKREVQNTPPFKQILFRPARGIKEFIKQ